MENQRIFIIGDVHGCLDMLKRLMDRINWRPDKDRLIFLGDYVDRGKDPKGVIDYILSLCECSSLVQCLIGNHEALLLDYLNDKDRNLFLINGGWSTLESYEASRSKDNNSPLIPQDHMIYFQSLVPFIELEDYYVVHAGLRPNVEVKDQSREDMLWIREPFIDSEYDFGKRVIFGHTPFSDPFVSKNRIGIDTGAVYGNKLTCLELPEIRFHSVEALKS